MSIKLDKILTMSAKDYCEMHGKKLSEYEARGIHYTIYSARDGCCELGKMIINFSKVVPNETEVIVDYRFSVGGAGNRTILDHYASGTALIPKNIQKDKGK